MRKKISLRNRLIQVAVEKPIQVLSQLIQTLEALIKVKTLANILNQNLSLILNQVLFQNQKTKLILQEKTMTTNMTELNILMSIFHQVVKERNRQISQHG